MRRYLPLMAAALIAVSLAFVACEDDGDDNGVLDEAEDTANDARTTVADATGDEDEGDDGDDGITGELEDTADDARTVVTDGTDTQDDDSGDGDDSAIGDADDAADPPLSGGGVSTPVASDTPPTTPAAGGGVAGAASRPAAGGAELPSTGTGGVEDGSTFATGIGLLVLSAVAGAVVAAGIRARRA